MTTRPEAGRSFICSICGQQTKGYGNNAEPVVPNGRCCDVCDNTVVIPTRIVQFYRAKKASQRDD